MFSAAEIKVYSTHVPLREEEEFHTWHQICIDVCANKARVIKAAHSEAALCCRAEEEGGRGAPC